MKGAGASAGAARKSHCANSGSRSARSSAPIPAAGALRDSERAGLRGRVGRGGADGEEAEEGGAELSKFSAAAPSGGRRPAGPSPPPVAKVKDGRGSSGRTGLGPRLFPGKLKCRISSERAREATANGYDEAQPRAAGKFREPLKAQRGAN